MSENNVSFKLDFGCGTYLAILTLIFIVLKLTETGTVAGWSWFWVLSPLLIPISFFCICASIIFVIGILAIVFGSKRKR